MTNQEIYNNVQWIFISLALGDGSLARRFAAQSELHKLLNWVSCLPPKTEYQLTPNGLISSHSCRRYLIWLLRLCFALTPNHIVMILFAPTSSQLWKHSLFFWAPTFDEATDFKLSLLIHIDVFPIFNEIHFRGNCFRLLHYWCSSPSPSLAVVYLLPFLRSFCSAYTNIIIKTKPMRYQIFPSRRDLR